MYKVKRLDTSRIATYIEVVNHDVRRRLATLGLSQERLARLLGIHPSLLTRYLKGDRAMPEGMEARIDTALDRLERAERAAAEARERVLAEDE